MKCRVEIHCNGPTEYSPSTSMSLVSVTLEHQIPVRFILPTRNATPSPIGTDTNTLPHQSHFAVVCGHLHRFTITLSPSPLPNASTHSFLVFSSLHPSQLPSGQPPSRRIRLHHSLVPSHSALPSLSGMPKPYLFPSAPSISNIHPLTTSYLNPTL